MKYIILLLLSSTAFAAPKYYLNTPRGRVQVVTPQDVKRMQEKEKKNPTLEGVGQEFSSSVKVEGNKYTAFIRGCNNVMIGDLSDESNDEDTIKKLKTLKNGDRIKLKMQSYGKCSVADWKK